MHAKQFILVVALAVAVIAAPALAASYQGQFDRTYTVSGAASLEVPRPQQQPSAYAEALHCRSTVRD